MKFDLLGRIENMRIPDGRTSILYSVYEAVSNAFHAIDDRFGADEAPQQGLIEVEITTDGYPGPIERIVVRDNGVGLNEPNLTAFNTRDSRNKSVRGGKGIGRLTWLKLFADIRVNSVFEDARGRGRAVRFSFVADQQDSLQGITRGAAKGAAVGTEISLSGLRGDYNATMRRSHFLRDLVLHFFPVFMAGAMPRLEVRFSARSPVEVRSYIALRIGVSETEVLPLPGLGADVSLEVVHLFTDRNISRDLRNCVLLVAHGRHVEKLEIERRFALARLPDNKAYIAIVRGRFLDQRVDQERTGFKVTPEQLEAIHAAVLARSENFLADHMTTIRAEQKANVVRLLAEHPQLSLKVPAVDRFVASLSPSVEEDGIGQDLFMRLNRDERRLFTDISRLNWTAPSAGEAATMGREELAAAGKQAAGRLADYVGKRRQTVALIKGLLKGLPKQQQARAVHDLICPLATAAGLGAGGHNLWLIDDRLAYYGFLLAEKPIGAAAGIFLNPLGFRRRGTDDPVAVVVFAAPGGEEPPRNPVNQVLAFAEKLRGQTLRDIDGALISGIGAATPFECTVVCGLGEPMRRALKRGVARTETADGKGFFGFSPEHNAAVRVLSYDKMLDDAERRNHQFLQQFMTVGMSLAAPVASSGFRAGR